MKPFSRAWWTSCATRASWRELLGSLEDWHAPLEPKDYYDILAPHTCRVDIWETRYVQIMDSAAAIAEWTKGSALRPFLDRLAEPMQSDFLARYSDALTADYPAQADGRVLFPFRRLFLVAQR